MDESDHENRTKELVPDSTDSDFEDAPMKKQRLRITDGAEQSVHNEGKVVKRRVRRTWTVLGEFDNFETSQTEARTEILNKAVGDYLAAGTLEPAGYVFLVSVHFF